MIIQIIASIAIMGLIYLVVNRIIKNLNYYAKSIINLSLGIFLGTIFFLAYYFDKKMELLMPERYYIILFITSLLMGLVVFLMFLIKEIRMHGFRVIRNNLFEKKQYLYLVYTHGLDVFLENNSNRGVVIKLGKRDFHDEKINEASNKLNVFVNSSDYKKTGEYIITNDKGKELSIYHAYLIKLGCDIENNNYYKVDKRDITSIRFKKQDKQIIFRSLLEEDFCIKINKKEVGD